MNKTLIKIYCVVAAFVFIICALIALNVGITMIALENATGIWWIAGAVYCYTAGQIVSFIEDLIEEEDDE